MEKNDYDKKRYTQMKIMKQDMEIMKKEIEQLKDALKQKVEISKVETPKMETLETPKISPKMETLETPKISPEVETLETPKVETQHQYGMEIPVKIDEMENLEGSVKRNGSRVIHYTDSFPPTKFTRHQTSRNHKTMKLLK